MQLKLGLLIINLPKAPLHLFPENYVPLEVINKLTLSSQQKSYWLKLVQLKALTLKDKKLYIDLLPKMSYIHPDYIIFFCFILPCVNTHKNFS